MGVPWLTLISWRPGNPCRDRESSGLSSSAPEPPFSEPSPPKGAGGIPSRQSEIYVPGASGTVPRVCTETSNLENAARRRLSPRAFAYVAGGAGLERTMSANLRAFEHHRIVPRMLRNVSNRDLSIEIFGRRLRAPLLLCPIGVLDLMHPEADLAVARAAARCRVPMIFSNQACVSMETCSASMGDSPRWFQLYWSKSNELVGSFLARAEACGCEALVVTLDTPLLGWRPRDLNLGYLPFLEGRGLAQYLCDPVFQSRIDDPQPDPSAALATTRPALSLQTLTTLASLLRRYPGGLWRGLRGGRALAAVRLFIQTYSRTDLTWDDLAFLRTRTRLPIVLKGVLSPDDASLAIEHGVDGIIVSNHGGRQVDGAVASLDALPGVVQAVGDRVPVLLDSGIRSGADIFKAIALGARAVCVGRPYAYGLALAGQAGVEEVVSNLLADFELTMALSGCSRLSDIRPEALFGYRGRVDN
jgi:lactate 2-monooxygenase